MAVGAFNPTTRPPVVQLRDSRLEIDEHFDLPPLNGTASRERIWGFDAAPNLVPTESLAMQGLDAAPNLVPTEVLAMQGR